MHVFGWWCTSETIEHCESASSEVIQYELQLRLAGNKYMKTELINKWNKKTYGFCEIVECIH